MDARWPASAGSARRSSGKGIERLARQRTHAAPRSRERILELLGRWQAREVRLARSFAECKGLAREEIEDLYQEAALALLKGIYQSEEHLRNALRMTLKRRALNLRRDRRRRAQIIAENVPAIRDDAEAHAALEAPERAALRREDRLVAEEFMTELSAGEQRVFRRMAEGMGYRAIAAELGIDTSAALSAERAIERKRERFALLYSAGRLCGYRSRTITALQRGEATSRELAERAFAHLESCAHCRAQHKTSAQRLRERFERDAAALIPLPMLARHSGPLSRLALRLRILLQRFLPEWTSLGGGPSVREQAVAILAGGGAAAKIAAGVATVTVTLSGTIGAHLLLAHDRRRDAHASASSTARLARSVAPKPISAPPLMPQRVPQSLGSIARPRASTSVGLVRSSAVASKSPARREPGGFAYLGVPASTSSRSTPSSNSSPAEAHAASSGHGGEFSP